MSSKRLYEHLVLDAPKRTLAIVALITLFFVCFIPQFRLDASSDSLLLEGDKSLKYYRMIEERYGSDDFLVLTYTPKTEALFSNPVLARLQVLKERLKRLDYITSATSIIDVPLVQSPPVTLDELQEETRTLLDPETSRELAKEELINSPLYGDLLISDDASTTAILLNLKQPPDWHSMVKERADLRYKEGAKSLSDEEEARLEELDKKIDHTNAQMQEKLQSAIATIREVIEPYQQDAEIHLGGVPMITADSINFVRKDLQTFGVAVVAFIILLLTLFFHSVRWVLLPMLNALVVALIMFGFLGFVGWHVTVVSSNFISLLLIFTLSFSVHQIVRYREYAQVNKEADQRKRVKRSTLKIITPCFFMVVTTIVAFASLVVSDIRPVIDFGWMMTVGLLVSFVVSFTLFPCVSLLLEAETVKKRRDVTGKITKFCAHIIEHHSKPILALFVVSTLLIGAGMALLTVENRFIDYYKESTEIYQGMEIIDQKLGGTTPLNVVIDAPDKFITRYQKERKQFIAEHRAENPNFTYKPSRINGYWLTNRRPEMQAVHDYLVNLPETGKVLSFQTTMRAADQVDRRANNTVLLAAIEDELPDQVQELLFSSYISEDGNQLRYNARVFESDKSLKRDKLLTKIRDDLTTDLGIAKERVHLTGMLVLYNNVLQSLFDSQIKTLWTVFITIFVMFVILFRNLFVAAVALVPNVTITVVVLGIMGWAGIPLDIMTITIAAICTGSADDNTIHYVHRFREEYEKHGNYVKAIHASHNTIGRAMYYTSITIMLGFSILMFSNFVPTIYFGLLTAFAMLMALLADLILLPLLLMRLKPLGQESKNA